MGIAKADGLAFSAIALLAAPVMDGRQPLFEDVIECILYPRAEGDPFLAKLPAAGNILAAG